MSVSMEINPCFSNLGIFKKVDNTKLNEILQLFIKNFNSIYIEKIYNIINHDNDNINKLYDFIKKYVIMNRKKIIDCIKKKRFSINELQNFINNIKTKFIFIKNVDTNFNNNINKIIFNQFIINPNICMLIYKNIINNNTKFIYYLQKILKSNNNQESSNPLGRNAKDRDSVAYPLPMISQRKYNLGDYMKYPFMFDIPRVPIQQIYNLKQSKTHLGITKMLFFINGFARYIIEDIIVKINKSNSLLNDYKLVYYYIENNFYNFNLYSKILNTRDFKKSVYNELLLKINSELDKSNYMFIVNNMLLFNNIIKKSSNIKEIIVFKKKVLEYTFNNNNFYKIPIEMFFKFFVEVSHYIIANDKNFKLNIISIFLKDDKLLEKFINYIIVGTYHSINYNTNIHILIETIQRLDILLNYNELFKIKFMNVFKNINNIFLLNKLTQKDKVIEYRLINSLKNVLSLDKNVLFEYLYNIYSDFSASTKNNININPYYWSINNNNYVNTYSNSKYNYLEYLHFGKTVINFEYKDNMINLTMLPIQYEIFAYFNKNNVFPKKLGNYSKNYIDKVILSLVNSKLILCNNNNYSINTDFKQVSKNLIEVFYTNKISKIKNVRRENAIDIKYVLATNINKYLKSRENNLDNIYNYLIKTLNIDLFNINKKNINDTLDYMIKQEYIAKNDNMYMKLLY